MPALCSHATLTQRPSRTAWRDFYNHVLALFPRVSMGRPFQEKMAGVVWESENRDAHLQAWKEGRTGVPIVDAGMRQANKMGWMGGWLVYVRVTGRELGDCPVLSNSFRVPWLLDHLPLTSPPFPPSSLSLPRLSPPKSIDDAQRSTLVQAERCCCP